MNNKLYQKLTGKPANPIALLKATSIAENMLGYTLSEMKRLDNQYEELGQSRFDCSCHGSDHDSVVDEVEFAYRLFPYNSKDAYLKIDPATEINKIKLVRNGVTYKNLDKNDYLFEFKNGLVKYIAQCNVWCGCRDVCDCVQLAVDANWMFDECMPTDLAMVLIEMADFYADPKKDIKRQTLGTHTYERFDNKLPEEKISNLSVLIKYAGPNGTLSPTITI